jgi:uncharacterized protein (TIGR03083 family)
MAAEQVDRDVTDLDPFELMAAEAARLDAFFEGLDPAAWDRPSACEGWSVRDVLAHLAGSEEYNRACLDDDVAGLFTRYGERGATDVHSFNAIGVADRADRPVADVLDEWRRERALTLDGLRALGDGDLATSVGPYPARWQGFHLASELAVHADDVGVPVAPGEEPARTAWRARVARFMLRESKPELADTAVDGAALVAAVNGRLPAGSDPALVELTLMP